MAKPTRKNVALEPLPAPAAAVRVALLELRRILRGKALKAAAIMVGVLVIATVLGCFLGSGDAGASFTSASRNLFPFLTMAIALLFAARAISEDVSTGAIHFLVLLPEPRWTVVVGKYMAAAGTTAALVLTGTVLLYVGVHLAELSVFAENMAELGTALGGLAAGSLCYCALFLFLGSAMADLPYLLSLLYVGLFELAVGYVSLIKVISMRYHMGVIMGVPHEAGTFGTPDTPLWVAFVVLGSVMVVFLGLTTLVAETSEYQTGRA